MVFPPKGVLAGLFLCISSRGVASASAFGVSFVSWGCAGGRQLFGSITESATTSATSVSARMCLNAMDYRQAEGLMGIIPPGSYFLQTAAGMTYAQLLWDNTQLVIRQSIEHRILLEDFILAIGTRIRIEDRYALELKALTGSLDKHLNKEHKDRSSIIFAFSALKSDLVRRENQTISFAGYLNDEVLKVMKEFHEGQMVEGKMVERQIKSLEMVLEETRNKLSSAKTRLSDIDRVREEEFLKLQILKAKFVFNKEEHDKQSLRVRMVEKEYKDFQDVYKAIVKEHNSFIDNYSIAISNNLAELQNQELEKCIRMMDSMKKMLVFEASLMRNFQYDISNISQQLAKVDVGKDVEEFAVNHSKGNSKPGYEHVPKLNLINSVIFEMITKRLDDKIKFERNEANRVMAMRGGKEDISEDVRREVGDDYDAFLELSGVLSVILRQGLTPELQQKLDLLLERSESRNYLQLCLRAEIQTQSHQTTEAISCACQFLVEKSLLKKDVFIVRGVLKIIFGQMNLLSLKDKDKNKNRLLYGTLYKLSVWRSTGFWEAAVFEALQQQLKISQVQKGETKQESKAREKTIILSQLVHFCYMMVMLGHSLKSAKTTIAKYCRLYGLGEEENKELSRKFSETCVVFTEMWGDKGNRPSK